MRYSEAQYRRALKVYRQTNSISHTLKILGYPGSRQTLYNWVKGKGRIPRMRSSTPGRPKSGNRCHPLTAESKLQVLRRCFELGERVQSVAAEVGYTPASIYIWRKKYLQEGAVALMNSPKARSRSTSPKESPSSSKELEDLKAQVKDLQLEVDVLRELLNVLKKDPGADKTSASNEEKAAIVDALKGKYPLPELLKKLNIARSSYYYQRHRKSFGERHREDRELIVALFRENRDRYGYRRIKVLLDRQDHVISEKVIRRVMAEEKLVVKGKRAKKYSSYRGEISPGVPNVLERNFHAAEPNQTWVTDVTEFSIPAGKIYLSPIIDCFDGMPVAWNISSTPNAELVNTMLERALKELPPGARPVIHSDRGCHYRWPLWIELTERAGLIRSMSKKGCSPDNAACEGFFGRLKTEMFYGRSWEAVTVEEFIQQVEDYMVWYRESRIKVSLGGMSPMEYRRSLGIAG